MKKLFRSFYYAISGIIVLIRDEKNAKIHVLATLIAVGTGLYLGLKPFEWAFICLAIVLVFITEAINTAIENTVDFMSEERKPQLKKIKDIAAGAVLMAALFALLVAALVFIPHLC